MKMVELRAKAKELGINSFGMKKEDLLKAIEKVEGCADEKCCCTETEQEIDLQRVAEVAYEIYERRGCLHGYHDEDWASALEIVKKEMKKKKK